jgi:alanine dehydrogenase
MLIGIPKEIKAQEHRVALMPSAVQELVAHGHGVLVQSGAGAGIGEGDEVYQRAGARIVPDAEALFAAADMVVKVKEPQAVERKRLRPGQVLFAYLHLAADPAQTRELMASGAVCIAFETVTSPSGRLPLLTPMSEIAGRLAVQVGANCLLKVAGGSGVLLGGAPGVAPGKVMVLGAGVVGLNATQIAAGMGADVVVLDRSPEALRAVDHQFGSRVKTVFSTEQSIRKHVQNADLLIGGVLVPGAAAPKLVTRAHLRSMRPGSVFADVSVDQGGCAETTRPTTHADPTYVEEGVVHYCVANMPGAVPRTSSAALSNAILPYVIALAAQGWRQALRDDPHLLQGLNVCQGRLTHPAVGRDLHLPVADAADCVKAA